MATTNRTLARPGEFRELTIPAEVLSKYPNLQKVKEQTEALTAAYKYLLKLDVDYGKIPGTPKATLFKTGAELLCVFFNLEPEYEIQDDGTDLASGVYHCLTICKLYKTIDGIRSYVGMGRGYCTSMEGKYRWRWAYASDLPADIDKGNSVDVWKARYGEDAVKWSKGKPSFPMFRIDNNNPHDLGNTIIKMSQKRSLVGAVLGVTGAGRIFMTESDISKGTITRIPDEDEFKKTPGGGVEFVGEGVVTPEGVVDPSTGEIEASGEAGSPVSDPFLVTDPFLQTCWVHNIPWEISQSPDKYTGGDSRYHKNDDGTMCYMPNLMRADSKFTLDMVVMAKKGGLDAQGMKDYIKTTYGTTYSQLEQGQKVRLYRAMQDKARVAGG